MGLSDTKSVVRSISQDTATVLYAESLTAQRLRAMRMWTPSNFAGRQEWNRSKNMNPLLVENDASVNDVAPCSQ